MVNYSSFKYLSNLKPLRVFSQNIWQVGSKLREHTQCRGQQGGLCCRCIVFNPFCSTMKLRVTVGTHFIWHEMSLSTVAAQWSMNRRIRFGLVWSMTNFFLDQIFFSPKLYSLLCILYIKKPPHRNMISNLWKPHYSTAAVSFNLVSGTDNMGFRACTHFLKLCSCAISFRCSAVSSNNKKNLMRIFPNPEASDAVLYKIRKFLILFMYSVTVVRKWRGQCDEPSRQHCLTVDVTKTNFNTKPIFIVKFLSWNYSTHCCQ